MTIDRQNISPLIEEFYAAHGREIEDVADRLGETLDKNAIEPLLSRLGDDWVQDDPDTEDAVCGALVKFGVMRKIGNLNFRFLQSWSLTADAMELLNKYAMTIPTKYSPDRE